MVSTQSARLIAFQNKTPNVLRSGSLCSERIETNTYQEVYFYPRFHLRFHRKIDQAVYIDQAVRYVGVKPNTKGPIQ